MRKDLGWEYQFGKTKLLWHIKQQDWMRLQRVCRERKGPSAESSLQSSVDCTVYNQKLGRQRGTNRNEVGVKLGCVVLPPLSSG